MIGSLLVALTLAQATQPTGAAGQPISIWTTVTMQDGRTRHVSGVVLDKWTTQSHTHYFVASPTPCNTLSTPRKPEAPAHGWIVTVGPGPQGPRIKWSQFSGTSTGGMGDIVLPAASGGPIVLNSIPHPGSSDAKCGATAWSLEARMGRLPPASNVIEADLWFVHKAPDGRETSQLQTLRIKADGSGEFYFDDLEIQTRWLEQDIRLTVEVFGGLLTTAPKNGKIELMLNLTRRYMTKQFLMGAWPKTGTASMPMSVAVGEVVSIVLPPLQDDSGVFLGHRFSLRLRLKPLAPGQN